MTDQQTTVSTDPSATKSIGIGIEWVIDAYDCDRALLVELDRLVALCDQVIIDLKLKVVQHPQAYQFPEPGGVTALYMLSESHLACHTYPEKSFATFNLYCCRARPTWHWQRELSERLRARRVVVRQIERGNR